VVKFLSKEDTNMSVAEIAVVVTVLVLIVDSTELFLKVYDRFKKISYGCFTSSM